MSVNIKMLNFLIVLFLFSCKAKKESIVNFDDFFQVNDKEFYQVVDTSYGIETLADGFVWSEGPLWVPQFNKLLFSDVPENIIYAWDKENGKQIYLKPSGYTKIYENGGTEGANGLALDNEGKLLICQHGNRSLARMIAPISQPKDSFDFLVTQYNNKKFNSPNDLHVSKDGEIFFTDPPYGLPGLDQDSSKELSFNGVFRLKLDGTIILMDSTLTKPNGIVLSKDERSMYVANSDPNKAIWMKYALDENKNIISKSVFADVTNLVTSLKGLPDGLKINKNGYIFASGPGGILIFHEDGRHLGTINTGHATSNCGLDSEEKYLYMTAHHYLMRVLLK